ncbi:MAG: GNAT family N-acetyltransferase [Pseudomonadota bacterium]
MITANTNAVVGVSSVRQRGETALGRIGNLSVQLTKSASELDAAQALRFQVFQKEFAACNDPQSLATQRDRDEFDSYCDHLIVVDGSLAGPVEKHIVGTYRLLPHDRGITHGFYSAGEFTINDLAQRHPKRRFLELGRSCVLPKYRGKRTIELLWQGIWAYCRARDIDTMLGCASFPGTQPLAHANSLAFLHHFAGNTRNWPVQAIGDLSFSTDLMPKEAVNARQALRDLPPLIKGYLRLGATYAKSAVVDPEFKSIDVFVTLPVEQIDGRYIKHFGENADRFAA